MRNLFYNSFCKVKESPFLLFFTGPIWPRFIPPNGFLPPWICPLRMLPFPCRQNYDEYLTRTYGDYMKMPDEQDRVTHGDLIVDLEKGYEHYQKKGQASC